MRIDYKNNKLKKQLTDIEEMKKAFGTNAKKVMQRMSEATHARNLAVLITIPSANCHQLSGNRKGQWAMNISPNHRLIFEVATSPIPLKEDLSVETNLVTDIKIIEATDYH